MFFGDVKPYWHHWAKALLCNLQMPPMLPMQQLTTLEGYGVEIVRYAVAVLEMMISYDGGKRLRYGITTLYSEVVLLRLLSVSGVDEDMV